MTKNGVRVGWIYQPHDKQIIQDGLLIWNDMKIEYVGKFDKKLLTCLLLFVNDLCNLNILD